MAAREATNDRQAGRKRAFPKWIDPMLATLTDEPFSDPDWIFERKLDGVRLLAFRRGPELRLLTRNRKRRDASYPEVADALASMDAPDFVIDGEIVGLGGAGSSFARLQGRMKVADRESARASGIAIAYYVFDIPWLAGRDLTQVPLRERKAILRRSIVFRDPVRYTPHRNERGEELLDAACRRGWEGLIAKRAEGPYVRGRSRDWLKLKCVNRQEFVIGGYTDPRGARSGFGALLIGVNEKGRLRYAGKVGTGYDEATLVALGRRLAALERAASPFAEATGLPRKGVHWVSPELVAEVGFTEWTTDGRLRHPRFVGLRSDKDPADVVRERSL
ncbi:MAG TPA: non-homologous end-joining DNA ligase [Gemmatimonadota bacterium]|nr:non-homologous end-joining DNA ligase [Gemmatimonadota bacterium]